MNRTLLSLVSCLVFLAACATPVPQVQQSRLVPDSFVERDTAAAQIWPQPDWWLEFGSPELSALIARAQADNRDLAIAAARVVEAQGQTAVQRGALFPQFALQGQGQRTRLSPSRAGGANSLIDNSFGLTLGASYEVDIWSLAHSNLHAAQETLKATRFAQQAVALT